MAMYGTPPASPTSYTPQMPACWMREVSAASRWKRALASVECTPAASSIFSATWRFRLRSSAT
jgi:hypothetical protein